MGAPASLASKIPGSPAEGRRSTSTRPAAIEKLAGEGMAGRWGLAGRREGEEEEEIHKLYARVARRKRITQGGARTVRMETVEESTAENGTPGASKGELKIEQDAGGNRGCNEVRGTLVETSVAPATGDQSARGHRGKKEVSETPSTKHNSYIKDDGEATEKSALKERMAHEHGKMKAEKQGRRTKQEDRGAEKKGVARKAKSEPKKKEGTRGASSGAKKRGIKSIIQRAEAKEKGRRQEGMHRSGSGGGNQHRSHRDTAWERKGPASSVWEKQAPGVSPVWERYDNETTGGVTVGGVTSSGGGYKRERPSEEGHCSRKTRPENTPPPPHKSSAGEMVRRPRRKPKEGEEAGSKTTPTKASKEDTLACHDCRDEKGEPMVFTRKDSYKRHRQTKHGVEVEGWTCPSCAKPYPYFRRTDFRAHLDRQHGATTKDYVIPEVGPLPGDGGHSRSSSTHSEVSDWAAKSPGISLGEEPSTSGDTKDPIVTPAKRRREEEEITPPKKARGRSPSPKVSPRQKSPRGKGRASGEGGKAVPQRGLGPDGQRREADAGTMETPVNRGAQWAAFCGRHGRAGESPGQIVQRFMEEYPELQGEKDPMDISFYEEIKSYQERLGGVVASGEDIVTELSTGLDADDSYETYKMGSPMVIQTPSEEKAAKLALSQQMRASPEEVTVYKVKKVEETPAKPLIDLTEEAVVDLTTTSPLNVSEVTFKQTTGGDGGEAKSDEGSEEEEDTDSDSSSEEGVSEADFQAKLDTLKKEREKQLEVKRKAKEEKQLLKKKEAEKKKAEETARAAAQLKAEQDRLAAAAELEAKKIRIAAGVLKAEQDRIAAADLRAEKERKATKKEEAKRRVEEDKAAEEKKDGKERTTAGPSRE